jgi:predicted kinase
VTTQLIMTRGLPASGKSTWAELFVENSKNTCVRVTKDQLRVMLNGSPLGRGKKEKHVLRARNALVSTFLDAGTSVIIDDTNFNPAHETALRALAAAHNAEFRVEDFTDVPLAECIKRDAARTNTVGERVIRQMWQQYLYDPAQPQPHDPALPDAIIVDIDGTLAIMGKRSPYDWHLVGNDLPNPAVIWMVKAAHKAGAQVLYLSGRDGSCYNPTLEWLDKHVGIEGRLWMRAAGDNRKDSIVKEEFYHSNIEGKYNVITVFDDRDQVVDLWRNTLGLPCFQVNYGNF